MSSLRKYLPGEEEKKEIKQEVISHVISDVFSYIKEDDSYLRKILNETIYAEIERWKSERDFPLAQPYLQFFKSLRRKLPRLYDNERKYVLKKIISLYMDEIQGHFSPLVYHLATRVVPRALSFLLTSFSPSSIFVRSFRFPSIDSHLIVQGDFEKIRKLAQKGTIIITPTHVSHMDSPIIGYVVYMMGLPPFLYGAGLNLFSNPILGFFMRNLGAYKVDRKRKHELYLDVLKEYVCTTLEREYDHIFFPEGTRSRTGAVARKLKMGLLGCGIKSFVRNVKNNKPRPKIFIVPATFTYHITLEAESLIRQYLEDVTREDWVSYQDEAFMIQRVVEFIKRIVEMDMKVFVRFSDVFDPFGNYVDEEGNSLDPYGRPIDPVKYILKDGVVSEDPQRDAEYTKELASKILETYRKDTFVLSTNLSAFVIFELGMRITGEDNELKAITLMEGVELDIMEVLKFIDIAKQKFIQLESAGEICVIDRVKGKTARGILDTASKTFSRYHKNPPFIVSKDKVKIKNSSLLYYYRNRLQGYISLP
jgi:glycerol-3-phosphate O-acyltransferase